MRTTHPLFPLHESPSMIRHAFVVSVLVLSSCAALRAEDWPQFRGPTGQGLVLHDKLPTRWSKEKNVVWKQTIPGKGWSSPIVAAGRVYLTTAVAAPGNALSLRTLCLDADSGKILWDKEIFHPDRMHIPAIHEKNSHASPTPILHGERLFVHFGHQGTACLDTDGKILWRNTTLGYRPTHGSGGSPIIVDDMLVFSSDGRDERFVAALNLRDGKVRWKTPRTVEAFKKFSFCTPLLIEVGGRKQIISPGSNAVSAYDPADGHEIWRVRYEGYSVVPRPVYGQGLLFLSSGFDSPVLLAIRPDGKGDVTETHIVWSTRKAAPLTPSPLLVGEELYTVADNGLVSCLDARSGEVHWRERVGGSYSASPLFADGKLYLQSEEGAGVILQASKEFKLLARNALDERSLATPAAVEGGLIIRTEGHLYRFGTR
jgi:outer membrane protein assembly factor BamB